jgi:hypothetical protein
MVVSRRRELVVEQTRRLARLRDLLASFFPGLERAVDPTNLGDLLLLARYTTPAEIRRAGHHRLTEHLVRVGVRRPYADTLVSKAITAAQTHRVVVPGEARLAEFAREFATEATATRRRIAELDAQISDHLDGIVRLFGGRGWPDVLGQGEV